MSVQVHASLCKSMQVYAVLLYLSELLSLFDTLLDPRGAKVDEIEITSKIPLFEMIWRENPLCAWHLQKKFNDLQ